MDAKSLDKLYNCQNISIRKNIREIDMGMAHSNGQGKRNDVNILVVGPPAAGKASLLKTFFYALNGSISYTIQTQNVGASTYERYEIKKNKKYTVGGLSSVKQTDDKLGISGFIVKSPHEHKNPIEKYSKAIEIIGGKTLGCIGPVGVRASINYVLVCVSLVEKISKDELIGMKFFLAELEDKRIPYTIVGTQIDKILGDGSMSSEAEQEKAIYMQNWREFIVKQMSPRTKLDSYFMQSYKTFKKEEFENSEMINYYALNLLQQIIKKASLNESQASKKSGCKPSNKTFWFCS